MKKSVYWLFLIALAFAATACGGDEQAQVVEAPPVAEGAVIAEGRLVPEEDLALAFTVSAEVGEVPVEEGDQVSEGDVLVRLADREQAEAALAAARLELVSVQQDYDLFLRSEGLDRAEAWEAYMDAQIVRAEAERDWEALNVDSIDERIDDRQATVNDREEDLDDAREEFDKYKDLDEENSKRKTAEDDLERAQEDYNEALRDLEEEKRERDSVRSALDKALGAEAEARYQYELSADGLNADEQARYEARLQEARTQVAAAEQALSEYELKAPFDGTVMEVAVSAGEMARPGEPAVVLADTSRWYVETTDLTELEVVDVAVGQSASLSVDALPGASLRGVVEEISRTFSVQGGDVLYTVRIRTEEIDPRMRWGMTVEVTFSPLAE